MKKKKEENQIGNLGKRIRVQFDIAYNGSKGKVMDPNGLAVPDLSLTVRQLLENHTRGKESKIEVRKPLYFDLPIPTINDITDVMKYRDMLEKQMKATDEFIKEEKKKTVEQAKAEADAAQAAKEEEFKKMLEKHNTPPAK